MTYIECFNPEVQRSHSHTVHKRFWEEMALQGLVKISKDPADLMELMVARFINI